MEKRWHIRRPVRVNTVVHSSGMGLITGRTRNLSSGGAYIEAAPAASIRKDVAVRVALPIAGRMQTLSAQVVRTSDTGFGITFGDTAADAKVLVQTLIGDFEQAETKSTGT